MDDHEYIDIFEFLDTEVNPYIQSLGYEPLDREQYLEIVCYSLFIDLDNRHLIKKMPVSYKCFVMDCVEEVYPDPNDPNFEEFYGDCRVI